MDGRIKGQYSTKAALETAKLTLKCLKPDPRQRPSMKQVLERLEAIEDIHWYPNLDNNLTSHTSIEMVKIKKKKKSGKYQFQQLSKLELCNSRLCCHDVGYDLYCWVCLFQGAPLDFVLLKRITIRIDEERWIYE